jgi:hypothetical protein
LTWSSGSANLELLSGLALRFSMVNARAEGLVNATTTIASAAAKQSCVDLIVMMTSPFAPAKQTLGYGGRIPGVNL